MGVATLPSSRAETIMERDDVRVLEAALEELQVLPELEPLLNDVAIEACSFTCLGPTCTVSTGSGGS